MKRVVAPDRCEAHGACMRTAPEVFLLDEQDHLLETLQVALRPSVQ